MVNALFWVIVFPFIIAFILGFITYNLGDMPARAEAESEDANSVSA